jgi:hypothetical protein
MIRAEIASEIIKLVPGWYQARCGPHGYRLRIGGHEEPFYHHSTLTPSLDVFLARLHLATKDVDPQHIHVSPGLLDILLESLAVEWLQIHSPTTDWPRIIEYLELVSRRTHETEPVSLNLVIQAGKGTGDITQPNVQKFLDRLASSLFSFMAVDHSLHLIEYGSVEWSQIQDADSPQFYPEFLHPIHSILALGELCAHLTHQGDLILMDRNGLLASRRRRKWKLYDTPTFTDSLAYCLGSAAVVANLLEVILDLSFRRRDALLIYDPKHQVHDHILNRESIVFSGWRTEVSLEAGAESGQAVIAPSLRDLAIGRDAKALRRKWRLIELANVDGALVFDDDQLLAAGAIIESHPSAGDQLGARTTAARSAYLWGASPVNVSSDGDVTVYFKSRGDGEECDAVMQF